MAREEQEEKVASMLGGLKRTDAPAGFEARVMRRIAETGEPEGMGRPLLMLVLKFAAPAAMLLLIGAFFVFFGDRSVDTASVPPVQENQPAPATDSGLARADSSEAAAATLPTDQPARTPNTSRPVNGAAPSRPGVMSEDLAVNPPGETYTPPGIPPRQQNADPSAVSPGGSVKVGDVLEVIGIAASCGADGCRVASISKGGVAERAKINAGDRIIAIDGRPVNSTTTFSGPTSFKNFRVVRGGRTLELSLSAN